MEVTKEVVIITNTDGEEFDLNEVVVGTVQAVTFGEKTVKISLKDIVGNRNEIQDYSTLRGEQVQIILKRISVEKSEVPVETAGQFSITL